MGVEKKDERPEPAADPAKHAPGVWVTEATGFACVPPRAQSDLGSIRDAAEDDGQATDPPDDQAPDPECGTKLSRDEVEPRIERFRER